MTDLIDVAIIGGGPCGFVLANLLGQAGLAVAIIEKEWAPYDRPRAVGIDHESLRTLQSIGLEDALRRHIQPFTGTRYLGLDEEPIKRLVPVPPPYVQGWPPNATFVQPELEAILRAAAARHPCVQSLLGHTMVALQAEDGAVRVTAEERASGAHQHLSARYVVGCDGASSMVRKILGTSMDDLDFDEGWVVVDALMDDPKTVPPIGCHYCWPSRPVSYVIGPRNLRRWELKLLPGEDPAWFEDRNHIIEAIRLHATVAEREIWRNAIYRFHAVIARDWRRGRIFIAGDAAHQMPPFLGQGLNSGIRDVANLAWKLLAVLRDGAPDALLDTYGEERRPHVRAVTEVAKSFGLIIGELDLAAALRRDAALRAEMANGAAIEIRQGYIPPLTHGLLAATPLAGLLFVQPQLLLAGGERRWLDDLVGSRFLIATARADVLAWLDPACRQIWLAIDASMALIGPESDVAETKPPGLVSGAEVGTVFADWLGASDCAAVVVRPDRYVFGAARTADGLRDLVHQVANALSGGTACGPSACSRRTGFD